MMGIKDAWSKVMKRDGGSSKKPLPLMTIQQVEELLEKRQSNHPSKRIKLIIGDQDYVIMTEKEHRRIMRVVESVERMIGKEKQEDA